MPSDDKEWSSLSELENHIIPRTSWTHTKYKIETCAFHTTYVNDFVTDALIWEIIIIIQLFNGSKHLLRLPCWCIPHKNYRNKMIKVLNEAPRHEDVWISGGIAPRIFNHGNRWRWVVSFTPQTLCLRGRAPGTLGHDGEEKKFLSLPGIHPGRPNRNLVTILTELPRLQ
jgi:hypothetical protein